MARSILFVCTGNVFRSPSAAFAFKSFLRQKGIKGWKVSSAGLKPESSVDPRVRKLWIKYGVREAGFQTQKVTQHLVKTHDIVVAMAQNHYDFLKNQMNHESVFLFNELAHSQFKSVWDVEDSVRDYRTNRAAVERYLTKTVGYIFKSTPALLEQAMERFYLFSDFVGGRKSHLNGYPFVTLYRTRSALAFMSTDIPSKEDGHIIVIPKRRYSNFADIPTTVLQEQMHILRKIGKALSRHHGGYNILLNNGRDAGQYIMHSHFHLVPRQYNDGIAVEAWKNRKLSKKDFLRINALLLKQIRAV